jgi:hypothetical protein
MLPKLSLLQIRSVRADRILLSIFSTELTITGCFALLSSVLMMKNFL